VDEQLSDEDNQVMEAQAERVVTHERSVSQPSAPADERAAGGRRRFMGRARVCMFCAEKITKIDYKNSDMLRRFLTERAKIRPRRQTGNCARHQRAVARAIKRARHLAMLPFVGSQTRES